MPPRRDGKEPCQLLCGQPATCTVAGSKLCAGCRARLEAIAADAGAEVQAGPVAPRRRKNAAAPMKPLRRPRPAHTAAPAVHHCAGCGAEMPYAFGRPRKKCDACIPKRQLVMRRWLERRRSQRPERAA